MKARIKATGDVVEVSLSHIIYDGDKKIIWYNTPQGASFTEDELEFFDTEENFDYWTRLEHQYAGMAMQGILTNSAFDDVSVADIAITSIKMATSLIERLKGERK